jgi:hypothetical protein
MGSQEKNCYLGINGKKYGPVSEQDIQTLYAQKKITGDTKFARIGAKEWIPLSKSGVITSGAATDDSLPPLPQDNKPNKPAKKSKLGIVAAILGVVTVAVIAVAVVLIVNINNRTSPVDNTVARNADTTRPTTPPNTNVTEPPTTTNPARDDVNMANSILPVLDKLLIHGGINHTIMIPSSWDYELSHSGFIIDSKQGDNIRLSTFTINYSSNGDEEFIFADGVIGSYQEIFGYGEFSSFQYPLDDSKTLVFHISYNYDEDLDWYNENEELLFAIAKTLSLKTQENNNIEESINAKFEFVEYYHSVLRISFQAVKGYSIAEESANGYVLGWNDGSQNVIYSFDPSSLSAVAYLNAVIDGHSGMLLEQIQTDELSNNAWVTILLPNSMIGFYHTLKVGNNIALFGSKFYISEKDKFNDIFETYKSTLSSGGVRSSINQANNELVTPTQSGRMTAEEARVIIQTWVDNHPFYLGSNLEPEYIEYGDDYIFSIGIVRFGIVDVIVNSQTGELIHYSSPGHQFSEPLNDWYNREHAAYAESGETDESNGIDEISNIIPVSARNAIRDADNYYELAQTADIYRRRIYLDEAARQYRWAMQYLQSQGLTDTPEYRHCADRLGTR